MSMMRGSRGRAAHSVRAGLDKLWFRVLIGLGVWVDHRAQAYRRRKVWRQFRRLVARQRAYWN